MVMDVYAGRKWVNLLEEVLNYYGVETTVCGCIIESGFFLKAFTTNHEEPQAYLIFERTILDGQSGIEVFRYKHLKESEIEKRYWLKEAEELLNLGFARIYIGKQPTTKLGAQTLLADLQILSNEDINNSMN